MTESNDLDSEKESILGSRVSVALISNILPMLVYMPIIYKLVIGIIEPELYMLLLIPFYFLLRVWSLGIVAILIQGWRYTCQDKSTSKMFIKTVLMLAWIFGPLVWLYFSAV